MDKLHNSFKRQMPFLTWFKLLNFFLHVFLVNCIISDIVVTFFLGGFRNCSLLFRGVRKLINHSKQNMSIVDVLINNFRKLTLSVATRSYATLCFPAEHRWLFSRPSSYSSIVFPVCSRSSQFKSVQCIHDIWDFPVKMIQGSIKCLPSQLAT